MPTYLKLSEWMSTVYWVSPSSRSHRARSRSALLQLDIFSIHGVTMLGEAVELARRLKRSLDGQLSYRKAGLVTLLVFVTTLYLGPGLLRWLHLSSPASPRLSPLQNCLADRLARVPAAAAHTDQSGQFLAYVGNGHLGLAAGPDSLLHLKHKRTLSVVVGFGPVVRVSLEDGEGEESVVVTDYLSGLVTTHQCLETGTGAVVRVDTTMYAHRTQPGVLVQSIKVHNPGEEVVQLSLERLGIANWESARSSGKVIEHGEGGGRYQVVTGRVGAGGRALVAAVAAPRLPPSLAVPARLTHSLTVLTGVGQAEVGAGQDEESARVAAEHEAVAAVVAVGAMTGTALLDSHTAVWRQLWTTGFGISHSYAEAAINGDRINATLYYVLSHSPTPLHSSNTPVASLAELRAALSYTEGCYSGLRTLQAANLWTPLTTLAQQDRVVSYWLLNLEKNGCHNLVRAGADGVMQAMVLSLPGLKFSNQHLEMNVHPRELHRDLSIRRINYGNETHVNISLHVQEDNKAAIFVSLDKRDKDYYACDAGCLDPPVKLGPVPVQFPVKLTEPVTSILYVTADHEHMNDLKHTIHVVEVGEAPAHEQHVLELHRTGTRLGGLHPVFWFTIIAIIVAFHIFLFR